MTALDDLPHVRIDADPAIWLRGPSPDATDDQRRAWMLGAQHAVSTDLDLEHAKGGADYREYLSQVLTAFSDWSTPANVTFLRFRHQGDTPLPVSLELFSPDDLAEIDAATDEVSAAGTSAAGRVVEALVTDPDHPATVGEVSREDVGESGWQRLVYWVEDPRGGVVGHVRHVRHFESSGVVAVVRFGGLDPARTLEALDDVDRLALGIVVGDES
ncbi:hypothetical protein [Aeromicrobium marinum]|uniref:hypothetical protein n=1 Tax=Aeromicrobium marinum TaxID=219314 RepID=UPI0001BCDC4D|nr:hypothetical protein [Aeromicrobium marinum]